jgi:hypothetical protein
MHQGLTPDQVVVISERVEYDNLGIGPARNAAQAVRVPRFVLHSYERDTGRLLAAHEIDTGSANLNPSAMRLYHHAYAVAAGPRTVFLCDLP